MKVITRTPQYAIGQRFTIKRKGSSREYEIVDILRTFNSKDELVRFRYVAVFYLMGQPVHDYDVCETTIARVLHAENEDA